MLILGTANDHRKKMAAGLKRIEMLLR